MSNMPEIQAEVGSMLGLTDGVEMDMSEEIPEFGAKDIFDLSWKTIMDAYSCTECGRCTVQCPANITGKKLSPRKIMMDIRDRTEEVAQKLDSGSVKFIAEDKRNGDTKLTVSNFDDGKSLFDYITKEELHACTTCNACVEACPVLIDPLSPILEMRRYEILTQSEGPADWMPMFTSLENTGAVWQMGTERDAWTKTN
jgi:Fe-S oxidoreductase